MDLATQLRNYTPFNEQEAADRDFILAALETQPDLYTRQNPMMHLTASAWIVNADRTKTLMAYHRIYNSWSWLGGHADGNRDLLAVALKEAREESGIRHVSPVSEDLFSVEVLTVDGHVKKGKYVSSHLHLNVTYLLQGDETDSLQIKADENTGVRWFCLEEAVAASTEPWFQERIYKKLNQKLQTIK